MSEDARIVMVSCNLRIILFAICRNICLHFADIVISFSRDDVCVNNILKRRASCRCGREVIKKG